MYHEAELKEREKELDCLYQLASLLASYEGQDGPLLRRIERELTKAMTRPDVTRINMRICMSRYQNNTIQKPDTSNQPMPLPFHFGQVLTDADSTISPDDFQTSFRVNINEVLVLNLSIVDKGIRLAPREKGLLESAVKLSAAAIQRLRNEDAIKAKNASLSEMLTRLNEEREKDARAIQIKVGSLILPLINQLRNSSFPEQEIQLNLLKTRLGELAAQSDIHFEKLLKLLTPRELEVCGLIRSGSSSKDIADILCISVQTVERHRCTIRKKLGINRTATNLRTYLINL